MQREMWNDLYAAAEETAYALLLALVGVTLLTGRMVDVPRSPANVALGVAVVATALLLLADSFGWLSRGWLRFTWGLLMACVAAFVVINCF